jgi:WD40 repeat protein
MNRNGEQISRFSNVIYGNFFGDGIIYSSGFEQEMIIFEGETKETWTNYSFFITSPLKDSLILVNDYDGILTCINEDLSVRWDLEIDYYDYNTSWSANGKYFAFCDYDYNFYILDTETGTITETFSSDLYYEQVFVRNNGEIYVINSEGNIEGIKPNKPLLTSSTAVSAAFIDDDTLMYLESTEELFQDIMKVRVHIYSLEDHMDKVIEESMILVPAPINQLVVRDGKVYFTTYTETESNLVSYDVATDEIKTLFTSEKMLLFPDIK